MVYELYYRTSPAHGLFTSGVPHPQSLLRNYSDHINLEYSGAAGNGHINETPGRWFAFISFIDVDKHGSWSIFVVLRKGMGALGQLYVTDSLCKVCNIYCSTPGVFNSIAHISKQFWRQQKLPLPCFTWEWSKWFAYSVSLSIGCLAVHRMILTY